MNNKVSVLFVDDNAELLSGLRRMLRGCRREWNMHFANDGNEALAIISQHQIDVVVSDMKMPNLDGAELLTRIAKSHPDIVRLILSGQAEHNKILEVAGIAHQFLSKPCDSELLQSTIRTICNSLESLSDQALNRVVAQCACIPCMPETLAELTSSLEAGAGQFDRAKRAIATDVGLSATVLQLVSSSFFGTPQPTCDIENACDMLGCELLGCLFIDSDVFRSTDPETIVARSFANLNSQSLRVSNFAGQIALANQCSKESVTLTRNAGLFHSLGRFILVTHFPDEYSNVLALTQSGSHSLEEVEENVFGVHQAVIGSCLLSLWGVDQRIVNAVNALKDVSGADQTACSPSAAVNTACRIVSNHDNHQQEPLDELDLWRSMLEETGK